MAVDYPVNDLGIHSWLVLGFLNRESGINGSNERPHLRGCIIFIELQAVANMFSEKSVERKPVTYSPSLGVSDISAIKFLCKYRDS